MGDLPITSPQCPQCNMFHPPIAVGVKCPLVGAIVTEEDKSQTNMATFLASMKDILESQMSTKGVKNKDKFFKSLIVELTKFCENYKE